MMAWYYITMGGCYLLGVLTLLWAFFFEEEGDPKNRVWVSLLWPVVMLVGIVVIPIQLLWEKLMKWRNRILSKRREQRLLVAHTVVEARLKKRLEETL